MDETRPRPRRRSGGLSALLPAMLALALLGTGGVSGTASEQDEASAPVVDMTVTSSR